MNAAHGKPGAERVDQSVPVRPVRPSVAVTTGLPFAGGLVALVAIVLLVATGGPQRNVGGSSAVGTAPPSATAVASGQTSSPGLGQDAAIALAKSHAPAEAVLVSAKAGRLGDVYTPPGNAELSAVEVSRSSDQVWAVTFSQDFTICPPDGSPCWSPRPGTTTVILDFVSGDFIESSSYAP